MARSCWAHLRAQWLGALAVFLILAGGSAFGGTLASKSALSKKEKKQARNIANAAIQTAAPGLSVARAGTAAQGGTGRQSQGTGSCDPGVIITACSFTTITLSAPGRVLVNATGTTGAYYGSGYCQIGSTSGPIAGTKTLLAPIDTSETVALTGVSDVYPAGTHSFGIDCYERGNDLTFLSSHVSAVALSDK
jgi:hypothetical protein